MTPYPRIGTKAEENYPANNRVLILSCSGSFLSFAPWGTPSYRMFTRFIISIKDFIKVVFLGFVRLLVLFAQAMLRWFMQFPKNERLYMFTSLILGFFLVSHWRYYYISFDEKSRQLHKTSTDDFLLFVIFLGVTMIPVLIKTIAAQDEDLNNKITVRSVFFSRVGGLLLITTFYILNMLFSNRIDLSSESVYSWQFYAFGLSLIPAWIFGLLGIKNYAQ